MLYNGNCLEIIDRLVSEGIKIGYIITSPPYNMATNRKDCYYNNGYSEIDGLSECNYLEIRINEFNIFDKILSKNGVILYNMSYGTDNPSLPIKLMSKVITDTVFDIVDTIAWKKNTAIPFQTSPRKLSRIVESIYVITRKEEKNTFNTNKEISKINKKTNQKFYKNYTNFIEAKNNDGIKTSHKATYSTDLVSKLIRIYVPEDATVLDPFMGICTTGVACANLNRNFIGIEKDKYFFEISKQRMKEDKNNDE